MIEIRIVDVEVIALQEPLTNEAVDQTGMSHDVEVPEDPYCDGHGGRGLCDDNIDLCTAHCDRATVKEPVIGEGQPRPAVYRARDMRRQGNVVVAESIRLECEWPEEANHLEFDAWTGGNEPASHVCRGGLRPATS